MHECFTFSVHIISTYVGKLNTFSIVSVCKSIMSQSSSSDNSNINNDLTKLSTCFDNYVLIDVGANLTNRKFSRDLESVVQRAKDAGSYPI